MNIRPFLHYKLFIDLANRFYYVFLVEALIVEAVNIPGIAIKILYLFSWDEISGNDNGKLIEFLKQKFGIDWVKTAEIEKIDNDNTIKVSTEINHLSLSLNDEKTKVYLKIDDDRTYEFIAKTKNGKLNIYKIFILRGKLVAKDIQDHMINLVCSVIIR